MSFLWQHKLKLIAYLPVIDDIQFMIKSLLFNVQANQFITPPEEAVFKNGKFTDSQGIVYKTDAPSSLFRFKKDDVIRTRFEYGKNKIIRIIYVTKHDFWMWPDFDASDIKQPNLYWVQDVDKVIDFPVFLGHINDNTLKDLYDYQQDCDVFCLFR